jgi:hypothetical protein
MKSHSSLPTMRIASPSVACTRTYISIQTLTKNVFVLPQQEFRDSRNLYVKFHTTKQHFHTSQGSTRTDLDQAAVPPTLTLTTAARWWEEERVWTECAGLGGGSSAGDEGMRRRWCSHRSGKKSGVRIVWSYCDRTTSEMRGLSSKIISGDSR